jgi:hypothetical protein
MNDQTKNKKSTTIIKRERREYFKLSIIRELETNEHLLVSCKNKIAHSFNVHPAALPLKKGIVQEWLSAIDRAGSRRRQKETAE